MPTLLIFILVISILVFVHELGHFVVARRLGVAVEEFGFGFPPRILGIRRGTTVYSLNWIPFGGFVRLKGENDAAPQDPDSFSAQHVSKKFAILASGVFMNYLLTAALLTVGFTIGLPAAQDSVTSGQVIKNVHPEIVTLEQGSPAARAGLTVGDILVRVDETTIVSSDDLQNFERSHGAAPFQLTIRRHGREETLTLLPNVVDGQTRIGVAILNIGTLAYPFPRSLWNGVTSTVSVTGQIFSSFGTILKNLVVAHSVSQDLSGPVGIVVLTGQASALGFAYLLQFVALLSATLAVVNFLPFPALDGGRALFVLIEAIRRKPVNRRIEGFIHAVGFYFLIALVLLVSIRDVRRFDIGSRILHGVRNLFGF